MNRLKPTECEFCGRISYLISESLAVCLGCIRSQPENIESFIEECHKKTRLEFGLPERPPYEKDGVKCDNCVNECSIAEDQRGYCGLKESKGGRLHHVAGTKQAGLVSWYFDPLPTNCVADWVCPGGSGCGYPKYSYTPGPETGYYNLAVFYEACTFNCLFCQNWHFRKRFRSGDTKSAVELAASVEDSTACICYFGGDPTPQLSHAVAASKMAIDNARGNILRICWETNGSMNRSLLETMARLSMESGGCIKFDIKAYDENLNKALCGVSNKNTLENFRWLASLIKQRPDPPLLVASTLLVPGYIDSEEISRIAGYISDCDPDIPYSLLAFYPCFKMNDLPQTSAKHAKEALEAAKSAGLNRVKIANLHLLSNDY
ncbi:MAG: radical SAM protein [Candidatus Zixiibacteriota bacterium]|nr:MAG: radical SAM protein [candidate division Zixibacteria bacterium]